MYMYGARRKVMASIVKNIYFWLQDWEKELDMKPKKILLILSKNDL